MRAHEFIIENVATDISKLSELGFKLVDLPAFTKTNFSKIVMYEDRPIILAEIKGIYMPFYCSTGEGGKKNVPARKWYPFFGIGPSGWLNKGSEESINAFYGSSILKTYANIFNRKPGDVIGNKEIPFLKNTANAVINRDMEGPQSHVEANQPEELTKFRQRINSILQKIGDRPFYK